MTKSPIDRRDFFNWGIHGLGATALASLLSRDGIAQSDDKAKEAFPNFPAKAKRAIHICLVGLSHSREMRVHMMRSLGPERWNLTSLSEESYDRSADGGEGDR